MTVLIFLLAIASIVGLVVAVDGGDEGLARQRPFGLAAWLTSGNWPAKVGAALVVVGTGALLRYAALNINVPPTLKLGFGIAMVGMLGFAAIMTTPAQRTFSLMLSGAAAGVSYLTAYTAFVLYGYLDNVMGLGLLVLTAIVTGIFAIRRAALSLALLAMGGAYLAPAFAVGDPGPQLVYGYYVAASTLTLVMVAIRGWRPLIHLSFLFTLVGGVFFAWNAHYYAPAHFDAMAPMLLLLAALHVAMPLAERRETTGEWLERLDLVYLLALPMVVSLLAIAISPSRASLSMVLLGLAIIWAVAAIYLRMAQRQGIAAHALIGALLLGFGVAARFRGLPWDVITLAGAVAALAVSVRSSQSSRLHSAIVGVVLLLGGVHAVTSLGQHGAAVFLNPQFLERMIAAGLLIYAGVLARRAEQELSAVLMYVGSGWAILTLGGEIIRWNLVSLGLLLHCALIFAALAACVFHARTKQLAGWTIVIPIAIATTVPAAAIAASITVSVATMTIGVAVLVAFALRPDESETSGMDRGVALLLAPIVTMLWVQRIADLADIGSAYFPVALAASSAAMALLVLRMATQRVARSLSSATIVFGPAFAIVLGFATLFDIERSVWAITTELACFAGLVLLVVSPHVSKRSVTWLRPAAICGFALFAQAMLLRWLGPDGDLSAASIAQMKWPTLISLLWAATGALLTVSGRKRASRSLWLAGATLLAIAAVKLMLVDFGSLGELANILAVIAAGGVFLLVGWLAPMPPAAPKLEAEQPESDVASARKMIALIAVGALLLARYSEDIVELLEWADKGQTQSVTREWVAPAPRQLLRADPEPAEPEDVPVEVAEEMPAPSVSTEESIAPAAEAEPPVPSSPPTPENACTRFAAQLPADYDVYVAGGRDGRRLDVAAGRPRNLTAMFEVQVNVPARNVLLVLGASSSALWAVQASPETNIVGIWLAGWGRHEVIGVSSRVPVLMSDSSAIACRNFHVSADNQRELAAAVASVFGRQPEAQIEARDAEIVIGEMPRRASSPTATWSEGAPQEAQVSFVPAAGDQGIEQLISRGTLRPATRADSNRWVKEASASSSSERPGLFLFRTYVVTGPMTFPAGLYGAHRATFILLPGVPYPKGNPGHCVVLQGE